MDERNWSNELYSDLFSLQFDNLLQSLNLDGMEAVVNKENEFSNTGEVGSERESERGDERVPLAEKQNENFPDESRVQVSSDYQRAYQRNSSRSGK